MMVMANNFIDKYDASLGKYHVENRIPANLRHLHRDDQCGPDGNSDSSARDQLEDAHRGSIHGQRFRRKDLSRPCGHTSGETLIAPWFNDFGV